MHLLFLLVRWLLILWSLLESKSSNSLFPSVYTVSFGFSPDRAFSISPSQETRSCFSKAERNTDKTLQDVTNTEPQCDVREEFPLQSHISCPLRKKAEQYVVILNLPQRWSSISAPSCCTCWCCDPDGKGGMSTYSRSCCSTWGLVKLSLQAAPRSSLKPI